MKPKWNFLGVFLFFICYTESTAITKEENAEKYRLNNKLKSISYVIDLEVPDDLKTNTEFSGHAVITVEVAEPTNTIRIHQQDLIKEANFPIITELSSENNKLVEIEKYDYDNASQIITISSTTDFEAEKQYSIDVQYTGTLRDDMYGFYRSSYVDENGEEQWIATTQFEPFQARSAFPCFDEPAQKAQFIISIKHGRDYNAISNTPAETTVESNGRIKTTFKQTPVMSTYLVAFIVQKFTKISMESDEITHSLYAPRHLVGSGEYALSTAPKVLNVLKVFTSVPFSASGLSKLDQAAIPDFSAGAMENWGLVTYRETALLWDQAESSLKNKQRVASVVAHELAHNWFGNLITCNWWDVTWFNEGFARYFEYMAVNSIHPDWEMDKQLLIEQQQNIFITDAVPNTQALTSECNTASEIGSKFGAVSYNKGASIIRMVSHFMGEENFEAGIRQYFTEDRHFKNTVPEDLWSALKTAQNINITLGVELDEVMEAWTKSDGFPLVSVDIKDTNLTFKQTRFLYNQKESSDTRYYVPISLATNDDNKLSTIPKLCLVPEQQDITYDLQCVPEWVVVNVKETAYYRVKYSDELYEKLTSALHQVNFSKIDVLNRAQTVDDVLNLARAGYITYEVALNVLNYLYFETEYYPWSSAFTGLAYLRRRIDSESELALFLNMYILNLMSNALNQVSFEDETTDHISTLKRVLLLTWACELGDSDCISNSKETFDKLKERDIAVDPNIRSVVYCTTLKNSAGADEWNYLWKKYQNTKLASESVTILSALGCSNNPSLLKEYLEKSINQTSGIRSQDAPSVFNAVISGNPEGVNVALEFLEKNINEISKHYALSSVITSLADRLTTETQINFLNTIITENKEALAEVIEVAENAIISAKTNLEWTKSKSPELLELLVHIVGTTMPPTTTPPTTTPPTTTPPTTTPPTTMPPTTTPPTTPPPTTTLPTTMPPSITPSTTTPSTTTPPTTTSPTTTPPTTTLPSSSTSSASTSSISYCLLFIFIAIMYKTY